MSETVEIVEAGYRVYADNGQFLEVTERTAVGNGGKLYMTAGHFALAKAEREAWEGRSWWRKFFNLAPKGYWKTHERHACYADLVFPYL